MVITPRRFALTGIVVLLLSLASRQAGATWSIVAVAAVTGEVGAAAATCTVGVEMIFGLAVLGAVPPASHFTGVETVPWSGGVAGGVISVQ